MSSSRQLHHPQSITPNQNTTFPPAALPLPCGIVYDRDVSITLRDGTVTYTDVFLPVPDGQYPALTL